VINNNLGLPPILHRFQEPWKGPKSLNLATPLRFNPSTEEYPWGDLRKILIEKLQMAKVPNGEEILPKKIFIA